MDRLLLFSLLVAAVYGSDVLDLGDSNFKDGVADKDMMLVEFYAPWCGHCKRLAPEYENAATSLKANDPPVSLAKVDCTEAGKDTCSKYGVSGYPTLKIFRNGEMSQDYDGPRDADGIVSYMKKNAGPSSVPLKDADHLAKKLDDAKDVLVVGFFSEENDFYKKFLKAADQKRVDYNFAHSIDSVINVQMKYENAIVIFRPKFMQTKHEDAVEVLSNADANTNEITAFIDEKHLGLVGQMKSNNENMFSKPVVIVYYQVDWIKDLKGSRYWRNRVIKVAKKFKGEISFAIAARPDYSKQIDDWGFTGDVKQPVAVARNEKGQVFKMEQAISVDALEAFVNEFKDDKLKPYVKSEPVPENNDGPVTVVVGENFHEIVNDPTKDVLIEFYAPWCGHCKSLEPKFNELGEKLKDIKDVVIAKMDATANDVPHQFEVQGFPTIYWAPMGNKDKPKKYQGGREVNDFVEFIKKEATNPVDIGEKKKKQKKEL